MNLMLFRVEFSQLGAHSEAVCSILYFKIGSIPHTAPEPGLSWKNSTRPIDHSFLYEWPNPVETIRNQNILLSRKFVPYFLFRDIKNIICSHLIRPKHPPPSFMSVVQVYLMMGCLFLGSGHKSQLTPPDLCPA